MRSRIPILAGMALALIILPGAKPADTPVKPAPVIAKPVQVTSDGDNLKPCLTLRPSGGVYLSWAQRKGDNSTILFARSNDGVHADAPIRVSTPTMQLDLGAEGGPNVAVDKSGTIYVVWAAQESSGTSSTTKPTTSNPGSITTKTDPPASKATGNTLPSLAKPVKEGASTAGQHAHSDTSHGAGEHGGTAGTKSYRNPTNIWIARSTDDGRTFSKPVQVNDDVAPAVHRFPFVSVDAQGGICVSWLDKRKKTADGADLTRVFFARSTDGAKTFGKNVDATAGQPYPICHCCRVAQTTDPRLGLLIAFRNDVHDLRDIYLVRSPVSTNGNPDFGTPIPLEHINWKIPMCPMDGPSIATDLVGNLHAIWMNGGKTDQKPLTGKVEPEDYKIFYRKSNVSTLAAPASGASDAPILIGAGHHPRLALTDHGDAVITWRDKAIKLATVSTGTHPALQMVELGNPEGGAGYPSVAVEGDRTVYCAWQQLMPDDSIQIYLCRVPLSMFSPSNKPMPKLSVKVSARQR